jgi:NADPH:quinone reductase-like Zn-dependent oxidoreductase
VRAIVFEEYGGPEVLRPIEVAAPTAAPGLVRVDLRASALNWHDVLVRQGRYGSALPHVLGADGAGVRADTGEEVVIVPSLAWGDRQAAPGPEWEILGDHRWGTCAESVLVPVEVLAPRPKGWSWHQSAALGLVGVTVQRGLVTRGRLAAGESVLVLGAGGGVATMAVQLASAVGADVWVTSSSTEKIDHARSMGAAGGVLYTDPDWVAQAREMSPSGEGFDLVLDSVGFWADAIGAARTGGRIVVLGASRAERADIDIRPFYFGQYEIIGTTMGSPRDFTDLMALVADGRLGPPPIASVHPLDRAAAAHAELESGGAVGKIVLDHT